MRKIRTWLQLFRAPNLLTVPGDSLAGFLLASPLGDMVALSLVFMLMTFVVFVFYGFLAHGFRQNVLASRRVQSWMKKGFALTFAGLGIELASSTQK